MLQLVRTHLLKESRILRQLQAGNKGWAFGLGLERLAMVLFDIPDIRSEGCHTPVLQLLCSSHGHAVHMHIPPKLIPSLTLDPDTASCVLLQAVMAEGSAVH